MEKESFKFVDLGLPSGTKWANMNLGATNIFDYGKYYAWGDTTGYSADEVAGNFFSDWYSSLPAALITSDLDAEHDVVAIELGSQYEGARMPTQAECQELLQYTTFVTVSAGAQFGNITVPVAGGLFYAGDNMETALSTGRFIFVPFSGFTDRGKVYVVGDFASLWSSSVNNSVSAWGLYCNSDGSMDVLYGGGRCFGCVLRPIRSSAE